MDIVTIIIFAVTALFAVIGLIIGLVKGFKKVKSWGGEYIFAALTTIGVGAILQKSELSTSVAGLIAIGTAVLTMLLFIGLSNLVKCLISRSFEKREDDMRTFGWVGVVNRIFGGISLALKGCVIAASIMIPALVVVDLSPVTGLQSFYEGVLWLALKPYIFDFIIIGIIQLAARRGFSSGISSALWSLIVFALAIGAAFMAYGLVFNTDLFQSPAVALSGTVSGWMSQFHVSEEVALNVAKWMLTAGIFILLLIVVLVVSFFVSRILTFARAGTAFYVVDGIFGGFVSLIIAIGVMLFVGSIIAPIYDLEFMQPLTEYFTASKFATYFYTDNVLLGLGMQSLIPLRDWLS